MNFLSKIAHICTHYWWTNWSNYRWKNAIRINQGIRDEDKVENLNDIKALVRKLFQNFKWTKDDFTQLWDAITPPPQNYQYYLNSILKDDCDGFHALVYHCLYNSGIECSLLTANAKGSGHCVLIFKLDGLYHVVDYHMVYEGFKELQNAIDDYNEHFFEIYKPKSKVFYNGLIKYNYESGKFKAISKKDF